MSINLSQNKKSYDKSHDQGQCAVEVIPAEELQHPNKTQTALRVAAYCRVSTGDENQQSSYTNQCAFYTKFIQEHIGWKLAGIYADEGISGTSRAHRDAFNQMIADAKAGKLDYIVTKSISRFARNTVDTLNCVRELRCQTPPVGIYFEKENLNTLDATGELILTILSALAQDESRSISDNIRWTFQKNFQAGIPQINLNRMLGYDKGKDGTWVINEPQAEIVRFVFSRYVAGASANRIATELNRLDYQTVNGNQWSAGAVLTLLRNEKYVGDVEMQKTVTKDFLAHRSVKNRGEAPKYYVEDHHVAIVDRLTWNKAQTILRRSVAPEQTRAGREHKVNASVFANLYCGICGAPMRHMTYTGRIKGYRDERCLAKTGEDGISYRETYTFSCSVWRCKHPQHTEKVCPPVTVREKALEQSFMEMLYGIKRDLQRKGEESTIEYRFAEVLAQTEGDTTNLQKNFAFFLQCVRALPDRNTANIPICVNGVDVPPFFGTQMPPPTLENAPDLLSFDKSMYCGFVMRGEAHDDTIKYETNFGLVLHCTGNARTLRDFCGFRRANRKGVMKLLREPYEIEQSTIQYHRYRSKSRRGTQKSKDAAQKNTVTENDTA